jgi:hypothetical protein
MKDCEAVVVGWERWLTDIWELYCIQDCYPGLKRAFKAGTIFFGDFPNIVFTSL